MFTISAAFFWQELLNFYRWALQKNTTNIYEWKYRTLFPINSGGSPGGTPKPQGVV